MGVSSLEGGTGPGRGYAAREGAAIRAVAATILLVLMPSAAWAHDGFIGVGPFDPVEPSHRAVGRILPLEGLGGGLAATAPIPWALVEPTRGPAKAPAYRWKVLDDAVIVWQLAGLDPVLVLTPESPWASSPKTSSAWHKAVRGVLPRAECQGALRGATGATPPLPAAWGRWERFVRDVVERYDGDGTQDMPGLRRPIRHVQILSGIDANAWLGDDETLLRLMHHAMEGARAASDKTHILAPTIDLRATGHAPFPDAREWAFRIGRITPSNAQPLGRLEMRRHFRMARRLLELPRVYDILCQRGSPHLGDDVANVSFLRKTLDQAGAGAKGLWLVENPMRKLGAARDPGVVAPKRDEQRLRQRWLPAALNPRHAQHGRALAWLRRGQAYDLVRSFGRARAAGADAVLFFAPWDRLPPSHPQRVAARGMGLLAGVAEDAAREPKRTASWYAYAQMIGHLGGHRGAVETPIGAPGTSVIFQFDREGTRPWVAVLMLDPRLSWAGAPGQALPLRDVLVTLPSGAYTLEWIQTGPEKPRRKEVVSDGSITVQLGPEPVYLIPKR